MRINDFKRIKYLSKITFDCSPPMREESIRKRHFWRFCPRMTILCVQYVRNPMVESGVFFDFWWFWTDSSVWENSFRLSSVHERALFQTKIIHSRIILNLCFLAWPKIRHFWQFQMFTFFWSNTLRCRIYRKKCEIVLLFF